jgi:hypothetical protein
MEIFLPIGKRIFGAILLNEKSAKDVLKLFCHPFGRPSNHPQNTKCMVCTFLATVYKKILCSQELEDKKRNFCTK